MSYRKTVVAVVYQNGQYLLVQKPHWKGKWDFPQGGREAQERPKDTLLREVREELGTDNFGPPIDTRITARVDFSSETMVHYPDRGFRGKDKHYFLLPFYGSKSEISLGDDLGDFRWCREEELRLLLRPQPEGKLELILAAVKSQNHP